MIKIATPSDQFDILRMTLSFAEDTYPDLTIDIADVNTFIESLLKDTTKSIVLLLVLNGTVKGMIAGVVNKALFSKELILQEVAWWVDKDFRKTKEALLLPQALEAWGKKVGASMSQLCSSPGEYQERVGRYYERLGYRPFENTYLKRI